MQFFFLNFRNPNVRRFQIQYSNARKIMASSFGFCACDVACCFFALAVFFGDDSLCEVAARCVHAPLTFFLRCKPAHTAVLCACRCRACHAHGFSQQFVPCRRFLIPVAAVRAVPSAVTHTLSHAVIQTHRSPGSETRLLGMD